MEINTDPLLQEFFHNRQLKKSTILRYQYVLQNYCKFTTLTPTQLIEEAEHEEDTNIRLRNRKVKKYIYTFYDHLKKRNHSPNSVRGMITGVKTFYREFEIELPYMRFKYGTTTSDIIPTLDDIKLAVMKANPKYRAIIILMVSSGMAAAEIRGLTVEQFLRGTKEYHQTSINSGIDISETLNKLRDKMDSCVPTWKVKRKKTGHYFTTFSTPESVDFILQYLTEYPPENITDYLFRVDGHQITENAFRNYFYKHNKRCGWGLDGYQIHFRSHNLRKYFTSVLYKEKLPKLIIDWLLAHRINPVDAAYFKMDVDKVKEDYKSVMEHLFITYEVEVRVITEDRLKRLEDEIEMLTTQLKQLKPE